MEHWSFDSGARLWRIWFNEPFLVAEVRDPREGQARIVALELDTGRVRWSWHNPEEPWWIGLEAVDQGLALVHGFADPRLPEHRGLIALDLATGQERWRSVEDSFLFWHPEGLCVYRRQGYTLRYALLDPWAGTLRRALGSDRTIVEALRRQIDPEAPYRETRFPQPASRAPVALSAEADHLEALSSDPWWIGAAFRTGEGTWLEVWHLHKGRRYWEDRISGEGARPEPEPFFLRRNRLYYARNRRELISLRLDVAP
jgi:hypothetical protein|nr:MAG: hypothetical protein KatS3mg041_1118 [Bacteroidota bacterium]